MQLECSIPTVLILGRGVGGEDLDSEILIRPFFNAFLFVVFISCKLQLYVDPGTPVELIRYLYND